MNLDAQRGKRGGDYVCICTNIHTYIHRLAHTYTHARTQTNRHRNPRAPDPPLKWRPGIVVRMSRLGGGGVRGEGGVRGGVTQRVVRGRRRFVNVCLFVCSGVKNKTRVALAVAVVFVLNGMVFMISFCVCVRFRVCAFLCVCIFACVGFCMYAFLRVCVFVCEQFCVCVHICVGTFLCVCIFACMHFCVCAFFVRVACI